MSVSASGEDAGCRHDASWWPRLWMNRFRCNCRFMASIPCLQQRFACLPPDKSVAGLCPQFELAEQERHILRSLERPQRLQNGVRPLPWPALPDVAAEFPLDLGSAHRAVGEARGMV